jgi:transposase
MAEINAIHTLHRSGYSNRQVAALLDVHRDTVAKCLAEAQNRPNAPTGSDDLPAADADGSGDSPPGPSSQCEPFRAAILRKLEQGLTAQRIYQDLVVEHAFTAKYSSVRRFVARLRKTTEPLVRRMEVLPGEEAQVDFGTGGWVERPDGKRRRPWVFRIVLSHSRKGYSEVVWRQSTEAFLAALENAFQHFGGVPRTLVIDNLKAAVKRGDWYDPEIHPKLQSFAQHYGTVFLPTRPYTPQHKGKVESGVKYVKHNALAGRVFSSLDEQNAFLAEWEQHVADTRIHGTTKRQVRRQFEEVERERLLPLPAERFPFFHEGRRSVNRDGHVEVAQAYYSAPPEYVGRRVWVRWDGRLVRLFNDRWEPLALHPRCEPGRFHTDPQHIPTKRISAVERGADWLLQQVAVIGPHVRQWSQAMTTTRGVEGVRVVQGLRALASKHEASALDAACRIALAHGAYRLRTIRQLLKQHGERQTEQQQFEFLAEHPVIRPLSDYSLDSLHQFRKERSHERDLG